MRGHGFSLICAICFFIHLSAASLAGADNRNFVWENAGNGLMDSDLLAVETGPESPETVYVSSRNVIYKTMDGGEKWNEILSFRGTNNVINIIALNTSNPEVIYAGTSDGLYESLDRGVRWKKIFSGVGELERAVLAIAAGSNNSNILYIGTRSGLFTLKEKKGEWNKSRNLPAGTAVHFIAIDHSNPHIIYAATDKGVYKSLNSGVGWKRIFVSSPDKYEKDEQGENEGLEETENDETGSGKRLRAIAFNASDSNTVYLGTSEGVFISRDGGLTWKKASSIGLGSHNIRHILTHPKERAGVYAATGRGVFRYSTTSEIWEELYRGLTSNDINFLAIEPAGDADSINLWAATGKGVFKSKSVKQNTNSVINDIEAEDVYQMFAHEPSIEEIREAAIEYAQVHPNKIKKWRKAAANKAWLPDLKFAYGKGKDWQSSTYYYNYSGAKVYSDDDITEGKDDSWAISLGWNLGDLIWNTSQTSIEIRSKAMVELRDDILNEVTRLYFERRRLQVDMALSPAGNVKDRIESELRLHELTANIDALTGSYLSKRLKPKSGS